MNESIINYANYSEIIVDIITVKNKNRKTNSHYRLKKNI